MTMTKAEILKEFEVFSVPTGGIGSWLTDKTDDKVIARLGSIGENPLPAVQLNQLLVLGKEAPVGDGFFRYYWLEAPGDHPYHLPPHQGAWLKSENTIVSLSHLKWGLYRLYVDALLYFGNVRTAFRKLRDLSHDELANFFRHRRFDTDAIMRRGPSLPLQPVPIDDRYLISEMAYKLYHKHSLRAMLVNAYREYLNGGGTDPTVEQLLRILQGKHPEQQKELKFSVDEVLDYEITSEDGLREKYSDIATRFTAARDLALDNTASYLSMVGDLDVYVATSMRLRVDFRQMVKTCEKVFGDARLKAMAIRYFDPTLSAARGHEDKGLIECLMVKCAKLLVYCHGGQETYGKDAEAAMALSLGKPVIFYCDEKRRKTFYRDVHPLSRLINFDTGVAVGAMVTDSTEQVSELIHRILTNKMVYRLERDDNSYLRLKEDLTESVVRLQTNDQLLTEAFWNHYHREPMGRGVGAA